MSVTREQIVQDSIFMEGVVALEVGLEVCRMLSGNRAPRPEMPEEVRNKISEIEERALDNEPEKRYIEASHTLGRISLLRGYGILPPKKEDAHKPD